MAHRMKHNYLAIGSHKNICHVSFNFPKMCSESYHRGSHQSKERRFYKIHGSSNSSIQIGSYVSQQRGFHNANKGGSNISDHRAFLTLQNVGQYNPSNLQQDLSCTPVSLNHGHTVQERNSNSRDRGVHFSCKKSDLVIKDAKRTMQNLNERLATYIEQIHILEQKNAQLEKKISDWYENNAPSILSDHKQYSKHIEELQKKMSAVTTENTAIALQIEKYGLLIDDFINRYEMELSVRNRKQAAVNGQRKILNDFNDDINKLETEVESLQQELLMMKRDTEQDIKSLTLELGPRVSVEVEEVSSTDLNKVLSEIRDQYENVIEKNRQEAEHLFLQKIKDFKCAISGPEDLQSKQTDLLDVKHSMQTLMVELENEQNMISVLEDIFAETQNFYASVLLQLQNKINCVQNQLKEIRWEQESYYKNTFLMDQIKHLEPEIAMFQHLLDGYGLHFVA